MLKKRTNAKKSKEKEELEFCRMFRASFANHAVDCSECAKDAITFAGMTDSELIGSFSDSTDFRGNTNVVEDKNKLTESEANKIAFWERRVALEDSEGEKGEKPAVKVEVAHDDCRKGCLAKSAL